MTKDELVAEIEALRGIVAMGQSKLEEDQYLDMEIMQAKVDEACQIVADLSPEDASEVRAPLSALLDDLQAYAKIVSEYGDDGNNNVNATDQ